MNQQQGREKFTVSHQRHISRTRNNKTRLQHLAQNKQYSFHQHRAVLFLSCLVTITAWCNLDTLSLGAQPQHTRLSMAAAGSSTSAGSGAAPRGTGHTRSRPFSLQHSFISPALYPASMASPGFNQIRGGKQAALIRLRLITPTRPYCTDLGDTQQDAVPCPEAALLTRIFGSSWRTRASLRPSCPERSDGRSWGDRIPSEPTDSPVRAQPRPAGHLPAHGRARCS